MNMKVSIQKVEGYAAEQDTEIIVNSANGYLLLGTSGAGKIRELSDKLCLIEKIKYKLALNRLGDDIKQWYDQTYKSNGWSPTYAQLSCLRLLSSDGYKLGDAVVQSKWSKKDPRKIIHAISVSYDVKTNQRILTTKKLLEEAITKTFDLAETLCANSIAIPVMVARKKYGLNPKESYDILNKTIKKYKFNNIKLIKICFDNDETKDYLRTKLSKR